MPTETFLTSFVEKVQSRPDSPALMWNGRALSYRELHELARSVIPQLQQGGLRPGDPVCVVGKKSPELVATLIACFSAGHRVLLPANDLGESVLARICEQAGCRHLITVAAPPGRAVETVSLHVSAPAGGRSDGRPPAQPGHHAGGHHAGGHHPGPGHPGHVDGTGGPGLLLTTSGSTGLPKTVPLSAAGIDRFVAWAADRFGIDQDTAVLNYAPLNFDLCLLDVWTSLAVGACVTLVDEDSATDGRSLVHMVARVHVVQAVPMLFRLLAGATTGTTRFAAVRTVIFTGDVMAPDLLERVRSLFPGAELCNLYGCTETNDSFLHSVDDTGPHRGGPIPIGRPVPGVTAAVLDQAGNPMTGPATGELLVRTPFQSDGYLDSRLDEGRFVPAPPGLPPGRYYRTGDLVRRDADGVVTLLGRTDFQVKIRGVRTNLQEVEAVIAQHADVIEAAVVATPDELAGHRLHAVVRRRPGAAVDGLQLRRHCASMLARTAIPSRLELVDEPLPRTSTGKIDRNLIRLSRLEGDRSASHV